MGTDIKRNEHDNIDTKLQVMESSKIHCPEVHETLEIQYLQEEKDLL